MEDETQLVLDASIGSIEAFEKLVIGYEPRVRRMIYGLTQDVQLTQDLCQETFLAAYKALPRMDGHTLHFAPWLFRIALNQVRSEWRRRKHVSVLPFSAAVYDENEEFEEVNQDALMQGLRFEENVAEHDLIQHVLAQLPPSSALCLILDAEGYSYSEIAETLQDTLPAIRSRLSRARQSFQRIYAGLNQEG